MANILIVDDDDSIRVLFGHILESEDHSISYAADGEAAVRLFGRARFDLVITDLQMPKSNGLRLIREIREIRPDALVIAISGKSPEHLILAEDYGAVSVLAKPIKPDQILSAVKAALDQLTFDPWSHV